jgi:hypothetical protein
MLLAKLTTFVSIIVTLDVSIWTYQINALALNRASIRTRIFLLVSVAKFEAAKEVLVQMGTYF